MKYALLLVLCTFSLKVESIDRPMKCPGEYMYCKFSTFFNEGDVNKVARFNGNRNILK